ncbi:MAG: dihydroorotase [Phormidesmis sp.]
MTDSSPSAIPTAPMIIQDAQVLLPSGEMALKDVAIAEGKITAVGTGLAVTANTQTIDGRGLTLLPGVIDPQIQFREPSLEQEAEVCTTSRACARGGVTSFLEMPNTQPPTTTQAVLTEKLAIAASTSLVNYGFFIGATAENLAELHTATPICGIQITLGAARSALATDTPKALDTPEALEPIFATGNHLIAIHTAHQTRPVEPHNKLLRHTIDQDQQTNLPDSETALMATQKALELAKQYERRLHILNVSTGEEAALLREDKPSWVTAEVTPQHLLLDIEAYEETGALVQVNPPLKNERDRELLWQALKDGIIDCVATAHAPHAQDISRERTRATQNPNAPDHPAGIPGVETSLALMLTQAKEGRCTIAQVANWMSTAVAKAYSIPKKGLIEPGYDADLVLVDLSTYRPVLKEELQAQCGWSAFEGWTLTGWPVVTIVGGQVVYDHGDIDDTVRGQPLQFDAN